MQIDSETILKWGGVGLVVLAVGFAVSTAIRRGWIGPEVQLIGAIAVSAGLGIAGWRLRTTRLPWTHALMSAGVAAGCTTVASPLFLDRLPHTLAYASVALIVAIGYVAADRARSMWSAGVSLVVGTVQWFAIADVTVPTVASSVFVIATAGAAVAIALRHDWFALRPVAEAGAMLALLTLAAETESVRLGLAPMLAAVVVAAGMLILPSRGDAHDGWRQIEIQLSIATAPWLLGMVTAAFEIDRKVPAGWIALGIAAAVVGLASAGRTRLQPAHFVSLLVSSSVTASIGLALLFSVEHLFVALAVQGAGLVVLGRSLGHSIRVYVNAAAATAVAAAYGFGAMVDVWSDDASFADDVAHAAIVVAVGVAAWLTQHDRVRLLGGAVVVALTMDWLGSTLVHAPQGQALTSASWAALGAAVLVSGAMRKRQEIAVAGLLVLGVTVAKLLTVDLRAVDTMWRAGLFLVIGLALLRLGFLLPRLTGAGVDPGRVDTADRPPDRPA